MKKYILALLISLSLPAFASANSNAEEPLKVNWSFNGPLGTYDWQSVQRGYQVYKEVCSACHSMKRVAFRNLQEIGLSENEVKVLASQYNIQDGPNETGDMFERPGRPSDRFPSPYPNSQAAAAANGGAAPPDLSLIVKARHDGPNYVYSILNGFEETPAGVEIPEGKHYNKYFPNHAISMPKPLNDGQVTYSDGTTASVDQMSKDVVNFLQWAAEPEMQVRKQMGVKAVIFLLVFTGFFYVAKRRIWSRIGQ